MPISKQDVRQFASDLGFSAVGFSGIELSADELRLEKWLDDGRHGSMDYMQRHGRRRSRPDHMVPGTLSVVSVRMDYLTENQDHLPELLDHPDKAYVARYALGRDYHKVMRPRLQRLADRISSKVGSFGYRAFVDSAPVMEKPLARNAGLGWIGKHTNLINKSSGSWFFLGELFTDIEFAADPPAEDHCGSCRACLDVCPTKAITAPYELDARRCISYLTIENRKAIPVEFREAIGNRIYGCDDCQIFCPWNKFARPSSEPDFSPRHSLDNIALAELFSWNESEWDDKTRGSAIRRSGYRGWLRNIAVALGNARTSPTVVNALSARKDYPDDMIKEHVRWALARHEGNQETLTDV